MTNQPPVSLTTGPPETVLPPAPPDARAALERALGAAERESRRAALAAVAAAHPTFLDAWAHLSEAARDPVEAYAYARVGYHRGLDALRGAGWRGSGYVRWSAATNHGFLRSLDALRIAAVAIGETAEARRCELFLRQLDPGWAPPGGGPDDRRAPGADGA